MALIGVCTLHTAVADSAEVGMYCGEDGEGGIGSYNYSGESTSLTLTFDADHSSGYGGFQLEVTSLSK